MFLVEPLSGYPGSHRYRRAHRFRVEDFALDFAGLHHVFGQCGGKASLIRAAPYRRQLDGQATSPGRGWPRSTAQ